MFGRVVSVPIVAGQLIEKGDCLVVVEAMKMEHRLTAVRKARVVSIDCMNGDQVEEGAILVELEEV
jgi:3-methylcrotonyl-CoA carboxylase alpha subunit